ncbi:hypothetical protein PC115_g17935 [Phytophthora cactorum]|uniref:Uncharacterized protein n=1 Tax=Phytophthora cactorum TaxID=29920 RepID=A0A8T1B568_9STRA|nr:hypothetical protein PC115_g17935 [Phytophthora cactorum]
MTTEADKAPSGSAPKTQCKNDIRKWSWKKNRAKRVPFQRNQRATKVFEKLQDLRRRLHDAEEVPAFPEPTPKGIADHRLVVLSFHPSLFEFVLAKSVSAFAVVSNQTAEKICAAVANYYGSYERRDAAGPDKWMIVTNDQGNTYGLSNPAKDAFVRQFMRGLKKRKSTEITQRQATPISLDMLRVLHSYLAIAPGFTEASCLWFFAAFAFYGMCQINEVLSLKWKNLTLGLARPCTSDPDVSFTC